MIQKPRSFLRDADSAVNFVRTDAVFAVHYLPHGGKPFVQTNRGILHDGSGFQCELRSLVLGPAMPAVVLFEEENVYTPATRAGDPVRPAPRYEILAAVDGIREVDDRFLKCGRLSFHA